MDAKQLGSRPAFPHAAMAETVQVMPTQHTGLTKRELLVGLALGGIAANMESAESAATKAVAFADATLAELAKGGAA